MSPLNRTSIAFKLFNLPCLTFAQIFCHLNILHLSLGYDNFIVFPEMLLNATSKWTVERRRHAGELSPSCSAIIVNSTTKWNVTVLEASTSARCSSVSERCGNDICINRKKSIHQLAGSGYNYSPLSSSPDSPTITREGIVRGGSGLKDALDASPRKPSQGRK